MMRAEKEAMVNKVSQDLDRAAGVLFLDYTGLTVEEANGLRRKLQESEIEYLVVKNTLMSRALSGKAYSGVADVLKGSPTGVVFGFDDPVSVAKATFDFIKECKHLVVKGGVVENGALNAAQAEALSKMPSKREVQASIVQLALSPGRQVAAQLQSPAGKVVGAIDALVEKLEGAGAA